jgi:hypothetical protein
MEVVRGHVLQRAELVDDRVIDQDIDPSERLPGPGEQAADVGLLRDVGLDPDRRPADGRKVGLDEVTLVLPGA